MIELPTLELPPGYKWSMFSSSAAHPCIQKTHGEGRGPNVIYYNSRTKAIRRYSDSMPGFQTIHVYLPQEEALAIMAQMAWLGEL